MNQRSREKNLRRAAERLGLVLRKSRLDGTWTVLDPSRGQVIAGGDKLSPRGARGWKLERIEKWLKERKEDSAS